MPEILINVINKIPQLSGDVRQITADNTDYTIRFVFDDDWQGGAKRVFFVREGGFAYPIGQTADDIAPVPAVNGVKLRTALFVGVQQGQLKTSRPCMIPVYHAITDMIDDSAVQPDPSMWEDILARVEELEKNGGGTGTAGIVVEDDGAGNVEIKNSVTGENVEITDDGDGNLMIGGAA